MLIGVPKEIKTQEYRVGLVPSSVKEFVSKGHEVLVETGAGAAINFTDEIYKKAGAKIASSAKEVFEKADMIIKVKEPQAHECKMLREDQVLFTYLHLAADPEQAKGLMVQAGLQSHVVGIEVPRCRIECVATRTAESLFHVQHTRKERA